MRASILCLPLLSLMISLPAWPKPAKTPESPHLNQLQKSWDNIKSYKSSFRQTVESTRLKTKDTEEGMLYVVKPGKLRWESKTTGQIQILNGNRFISIQPKKRRGKTVVDIYSDATKTIDLRSLDFFAGKLRFKASFTPTTLSETPDSVTLKLTPRNSKEDSMVAEVEKPSYLLRALSFLSVDNMTRIELSTTETNLELDSKLFEYERQAEHIVHENP